MVLSDDEVEDGACLARKQPIHSGFEEILYKYLSVLQVHYPVTEYNNTTYPLVYIKFLKFETYSLG